MAEHMDTSVAPGPSAPPCLPPGGLFEIVFSFDTTGSMSSVADEVKGRLQDMIQRLQADIPGIRIGVIAHGDYCDKDIFYLEKHIDFSTNIVELCDFLKDIEGTGGGDPEECYEYVLRLASQFSWTPGSQRALVVIGDATPHEPEYDLNTDNIDWRKEAENLGNMGIKVYGVQAFENADSTAFFQELVEKTAGHHVKLGEFSHICDFIMAICYRERGEDFLVDYEAEVRAREGRKKLANDLEGLFGVLRRGDSSVSNKSGSPSVTSAADRVSALPGLGLQSRSSSSRSLLGTLSRSSSAASSVIMNIRKPVKMVSPLPSFASVPSTSGVVLPVVNKVKPIVKKTVPRKCAKNSAIDGQVLKKSQRTLRHKVPDTKFILKQNGLAKRWSPWKLAITNDMPKSEKSWVKRGSKSTVSQGWRRKQLFAKQSGKTRVLYEIAVQANHRARLQVVFSKWGLIGTDPESWESRIFANKNIRAKVNDALDLNGKVFIRRFVTKGLGKRQRESMKLYRSQYSYKWSLPELH